jgi:hypothetical protein
MNFLTLGSFILEGILTVVVAVASYFFVWDEPATATFLTKDEKKVILDALSYPHTETFTNAQLGGENSFKWKHVMNAAFDWQVRSFHPLFLPQFFLSILQLRENITDNAYQDLVSLSWLLGSCKYRVPASSRLTNTSWTGRSSLCTIIIPPNHH